MSPFSSLSSKRIIDNSCIPAKNAPSPLPLACCTTSSDSNSNRSSSWAGRGGGGQTEQQDAGHNKQAAGAVSRGDAPTHKAADRGGYQVCTSTPGSGKKVLCWARDRVLLSRSPAGLMARLLTVTPCSGASDPTWRTSTMHRCTRGSQWFADSLLGQQLHASMRPTQ